MRSAMWGFVLSLDPEILRSAAVNNDKITLHMMNLTREKLYVKKNKNVRKKYSFDFFGFSIDLAVEKYL